MAVESHVCPSCAESVPPGRLSCPHCGTVLAAVARRVDLAVAAAPAVPPTPAPQPETPVAVAWEDDDAEPALEPEPEPYKPWPMPATPAPAAPAAPVTAPASPFVAAGTYVAPVTVPPAPEPVEPAPETESRAPADLPPAPVFPRAWDPAGAAAGEGVLAATAPAGVPRLGGFALPRIDKDRVEDAADAMMLVGAFGLVLAFLAPWARIVIGSRGSGYMDTWGLAGSGHIALFLLALAVLGLAVFQNPIGRWLRTGVLGVALGSFVLGLAWPYVVGPLGAGPGALLAWVSGLVMFIAGTVSLLVLRHGALPSDV
jgi:hypothetical protein